MGRSLHPDKEIEAALQYAEASGWRIETSHGHAWGRIFCPFNNSACRSGEFCIASVWSTPKDARNHARQIYRVVDKCRFRQQVSEMDQES